MKKLERQKNAIGATWVKVGIDVKNFLTFTISPNLNPKFMNFWMGKKL
jgi:hypothetical protein